MNKSELIDVMAADAGISKAAAKAALESLTTNVTKSLKKGGKVALVGWGTWSVSKRKARSGSKKNNRFGFSYWYRRSFNF